MFNAVRLRSVRMLARPHKRTRQPILTKKGHEKIVDKCHQSSNLESLFFKYNCVLPEDLFNKFLFIVLMYRTLVIASDAVICVALH